MSKIKKNQNANKSETASENKTVINLALLRNALNQINIVIFSKSFDGAENPLVTATSWTVQRNILRDTSITAKKVLDICCQPGRVFDMLERFEAFVNSINENMNIEIVRAKGYCNYIFYVEEEMKKLRDGYEDLYEEKSLAVSFGCQTVLDFIKSDCLGIAGVSKLISAKLQAEEILSKTKEEIVTEDIKTYHEILGIAENCREAFALSVPEIKEIAVSVANQTQAMKRNITRARELHTLLTEKLTKEWFDGINYELETCPVNQMEIPGIKLYLGEKIEEIKEVSLKYEK